MSRWEADANASADLFFSQSTNLFLDLLKKDRAHTASMASLLGVVSAKDFSVDRYLEVQGILLNEVNVKIGSQASADAAWGNIANQIQALNYADAPSPFYRDASRKINTYIGQPGPGENLFPVWGSGRAAADDIQHGRAGAALWHSALAWSDIYLVRSIGHRYVERNFKN